MANRYTPKHRGEPPVDTDLYDGYCPGRHCLGLHIAYLTHRGGLLAMHPVDHGTVSTLLGVVMSVLGILLAVLVPSCFG